MADKIERRMGSLAAGDNLFVITGRAVSYNTLSAMNVPAPGWREQIAPGCFRESLGRGDEICALVNHDPSQILGRTRNSTLMLADEVSGLDFKIKLNPAVQAHRDLYALVKDKTLGECSFGFTVDDDDWSMETKTRTVRKAKLFDVSIVSYPAYTAGTSAQARSLQDEKLTDAEREELRTKFEKVKLF